MNTPISSSAAKRSVAIYGIADLVQFGINGLTGEACAYSLRILSDVNEQGKQLLAEFYGMPNIQLADGMNSQVNGEPTVGSFMLARDSFGDLACFAVLRDGALGYREQSDGSILAIYEQELLNQYLNNGYDVVRNPVFTSNQPRVGSRNVHAFTGRSV